MFRAASLAGVASLLLASSASAQDKIADIDKIFSFATTETPGCAVGVSQQGKVIVSRAYGLADIDRKTPLSANSKFDIGSTQKQFTAASMLLLVQEGRLSLSDDIHKYLPELPDYGQKITIDNLLTHTSGVRD
jgi:CubicO group peptidase (beta-lactamase class C family)